MRENQRITGIYKITKSQIKITIKSTLAKVKTSLYAGDSISKITKQCRDGMKRPARKA